MIFAGEIHNWISKLNFEFRYETLVTDRQKSIQEKSIQKKANWNKSTMCSYLDEQEQQEVNWNDAASYECLVFRWARFGLMESHIWTL